MRVLLFGPLADLAGWRTREIEGPSSLNALRAFLANENSGLRSALDGPGVQVAVDQALVRCDAALTTASEVAFLPPMSGG
jgi:molybdopterin synthase sulfur carrier subunit